MKRAKTSSKILLLIGAIIIIFAGVITEYIFLYEREITFACVQSSNTSSRANKPNS
ncbi:MAG TPA: hypothetical protein VIO64_02565 [Pseudobacteroides sp.]